MAVSRSLSDCAPELQTVWPLIAADYEAAFPDRSLEITCTHRPQPVQDALYAQGRAPVSEVNALRDRAGLPAIKASANRQVTWVRHSKHTAYPAHALDFVVLVNGKASYLVDLYKPFPEICARHGLRSGGLFKVQDWCHVEMP